MTHPLTLLELETLLVTMNSMLRAAKASEWGELARLDDARREILYGTPVNPEPMNSESASATYRQLSDLVRKLDQEIISTAQQVRQSLVDQNRDLRGQVKARQVYQQASMMRTASNHLAPQGKF